MKKFLLALIIIIIIGCVIVLILASYFNKNKTSLTLADNRKTENFLIPANENFFDTKFFNQAIEKSSNSKNNKDIKAVIIPHHLIASEIIADILRQSQNDSIKDIAIIGPSHEDLGPTTIICANAIWQTPLGQVQTNSELAGKFLADLKLHDNPSSFLNEHSIGAIIPFVKNYYPKARVLPILFNSTASIKDAKDVADWFNQNLDDNALIVFSIDFSHYLKEYNAKNNDEVVKNLITSRDINKIINLNSDYLDSPAALVTAIMYVDAKNLKTEILYEKTSNDFLEQPSVETTSYLGVVFIK
ncbi:MAG: AmmeMemoRadiSam system protein B [bacterium]